MGCVPCIVVLWHVRVAYRTVLAKLVLHVLRTARANTVTAQQPSVVQTTVTYHSPLVRCADLSKHCRAKSFHEGCCFYDVPHCGVCNASHRPVSLLKTSQCWHSGRCRALPHIQWEVAHKQRHAWVAASAAAVSRHSDTLPRTQRHVVGLDTHAGLHPG